MDKITHCVLCDRLYDWERFKVLRLEGCPICKPNDWMQSIKVQPWN